jgi:alpha-galactosidase
LQRLRYGLAATLLGRVCLSGEMHTLDTAQRAEINTALEFYQAAAPVIRDGRSRIHRAMNASWNEPRGWQVVMRHTPQTALAVVHAFGSDAPLLPEVPLPTGNWRIAAQYGDLAETAIIDNTLSAGAMKPFSGGAVLLHRV